MGYWQHRKWQKHEILPSILNVSLVDPTRLRRDLRPKMGLNLLPYPKEHLHVPTLLPSALCPEFCPQKMRNWNRFVNLFVANFSAQRSTVEPVDCSLPVLSRSPCVARCGIQRLLESVQMTGLNPGPSTLDHEVRTLNPEPEI